MLVIEGQPAKPSSPVTKPRFNIIIPAFNEVATIGKVLADLNDELKDMGEWEPIVVDDGSVDGTANEVPPHVQLLRHPVNRGHGAAIKTGVRASTAPIIIVFDADGQHDSSDIRRLMEKMTEGYDLVIGNRRRLWKQKNGRGNTILSLFASVFAGQYIPDLTSGLRAAKRDVTLKFLPLVPDRFCFEITTSVSFCLNQYKVAFIEIDARVRQGGKSKIRVIADGFRFGFHVLHLWWNFKILKNYRTTI